MSGLNADAFLYVDYIIVFGCTLKHHNLNLLKVIDKCRL